MTRALAAAFAALLILAPTAVAQDLPMDLPGEATASSVRADPDTWLVGAVPDAASARLAKRFAARHIGLPQTGGYSVARSQARAFADALKARHLLVYAQANVLRKPLTIPDDPLSGPPNNWRATVADPSLTPPLVTPQSPLIALVDAAADLTHPEWTGDPNVATLPGTPVDNSHGTATMSVAAAPQNGIGILGVWPGARAPGQTPRMPMPFCGAAATDIVAVPCELSTGVPGSVATFGSPVHSGWVRSAAASTSAISGLSGVTGGGISTGSATVARQLFGGPDSGSSGMLSALRRTLACA